MIAFIVLGRGIVVKAVYLRSDISKFWDDVSFMMIIFGIVASCLLIAVFGAVHIDTKGQIAKNQETYDFLISAIRSIDEDDPSEFKELLIRGVNEWNEDVEEEKRYAENPWVNWISNQKVVNKMQYIELSDYNIEIVYKKSKQKESA